jgi:hypothetical protein
MSDAAYTELLKAIEDVLDLPLAVTLDGRQARLECLSDRVFAVHQAIVGALATGRLDDEAAWLRRHVAEKIPTPAYVAYVAREVRS